MTYHERYCKGGSQHVLLLVGENRADLGFAASPQTWNFPWRPKETQCFIDFSFSGICDVKQISNNFRPRPHGGSYPMEETGFEEVFQNLAGKVVAFGIPGCENMGYQ